MTQEGTPILWVTFAPVAPDWIVPTGIALPYQFSDGISYRMLPEWIWEEATADGLRPQLREKIDSGELHCIAVEYQASELGANQVAATKKIFAAHLALWLARPTGLSFDVIVHAEKYGSDWLTRHIVSYDRARPLAEYEHESFSIEDFERAKGIFQAIERIPREGAVRTALGATTRALVEGSWELRYLLYWLAIEALFGPEDGREITFRLSQRVAMFLETEGAKARIVFEQVKEGYRWRSQIVHGLKLSKLQEGKADKLLSVVEGLLRRVFVAILSEETMAERFEGKGREEFLDSLAFR